MMDKNSQQILDITQELVQMIREMDPEKMGMIDSALTIQRVQNSLYNLTMGHPPTEIGWRVKKVMDLVNSLEERLFEDEKKEFRNALFEELIVKGK